MKYLIMLLMIGCAHNESSHQDNRLEPYIAELKMEFYEVTGRFLNTDTSIEFTDLNNHCSSLSILISEPWFDQLKDEPGYVKATLLSSLGTCLYGFDDYEIDWTLFEFNKRFHYNEFIERAGL